MIHEFSTIESKYQSSKPPVRLENWEIQKSLTPTGETCFVLHGEVWGHYDHCLLDGQVITTSQLVYVDLHNMTAHTKNTEYALGSIAKARGELVMPIDIQEIK